MAAGNQTGGRTTCQSALQPSIIYQFAGVGVLERNLGGYTVRLSVN